MKSPCEFFDLRLPSTPLNLTVFLAIIAAFVVWYLLWRTKLGYEIRAVGANTEAAIYAGIKPERIIIITMAISGALAGLMAVNEVLGVQHRLLLEFVGGAGFVGIAVALMGRSHPVGIVLAAMLFGLLYQGGAELSFAKPLISRDMIVVIQGLVILFMGALEYAFRPALARHLRQGGGLVMDLSLIAEVLASTIRLSVPLVLACLAGLWSEKSGIVDIGLEGKMLAAAFAAAAAASYFQSAWIGLVDCHCRFPRLCPCPWLRLHQPARQPGRLGRRHQHAGGGPCRGAGQYLVQGRRPHPGLACECALHAD